jgi:hypothetical protein
MDAGEIGSEAPVAWVAAWASGGRALVRRASSPAATVFRPVPTLRVEEVPSPRLTRARVLSERSDRLLFVKRIG